MKKVIVILSLVLVFALSACAPGMLASAAATPNRAPAAGQGSLQNQVTQPAAAAPRSITVNGTGQITLAPEIAYVYIGVHSQAETVAAALDQNNQIAQSVTAALKDLGIAENDIQTSSFNVYPQQNYGPQGEMLPATSYVVDNTVYITVRDLPNLGKVLDVSVRAGANSINGITFDVTDATKNQAIADARKAAVDSARSQADALANAAGVSVGELVTLSAYLTNNPIPMMDARGGYAAGASQVPISAGQVVIHVEVSATYSIQ